MPTGAPSSGLPEVTVPREGPLATRPWPEGGAAEGRLVEGFPRALRPLRRSTVLSSSLSPSADRLQVALEATTPVEAGAVLRAYRAKLVPRGLVEEPPPAGQLGTETLTVRRAQTSVTVQVSTVDGLTHYVLYAVVHAEG